MSKNLENNMSGDLGEKVNARSLPEYKVQEIIDSYDKCNGNATKASRELNKPIQIIIKYWRKSGLKIRKRGLPKGSFRDVQSKERVNLIKKLVSQGKYQSEIAKELNVSRQSVNQLIEYYNLTKPHNEIKRIKEKKYNLVNRLIEEGDSFKDIAEFTGFKRVDGLYGYLKRYPELPKPITIPQIERERKINLIKQGILQGLNQGEISKKEGVGYNLVYRYTHKYEELKNLLGKTRKKE
jgi:transposase